MNMHSAKTQQFLFGLISDNFMENHREVCNGDFVIVNQTELNKFKKKFFSILDLCPTSPRTVTKAPAIMNIWMKFCNLSLKSMPVLGGIYYLISPSGMDDFLSVDIRYQRPMF